MTPVQSGTSGYPGDPLLAATDRLAALTQPYQGQMSMTLTYPALGRARQILWLVFGRDLASARALNAEFYHARSAAP